MISYTAEVVCGSFKIEAYLLHQMHETWMKNTSYIDTGLTLSIRSQEKWLSCDRLWYWRATLGSHLTRQVSTDISSSNHDSHFCQTFKLSSVTDRNLKNLNERLKANSRRMVVRWQLKLYSFFPFNAAGCRSPLQGGRKSNRATSRRLLCIASGCLSSFLSLFLKTVSGVVSVI